MLYEVRSMSGALMMVLCCNGVGLAAKAADSAAKLYGIVADRIVRTADEGKLPKEAIEAANRFGEWISSSAQS